MLILLTFGVLALALFVVVELEVDDPLLDVRVFRVTGRSPTPCC